MADEYKINVRKILTRSQDEVARDERLFAQAKAALSHFVPKTDAQHAYLMGISRQKAIYPAYRQLRLKPDSVLNDSDLQNFIVLRDQLSECAALQANFFRAARLHHSSHQAGEYLVMGNAVKMRRFPHSCSPTRLELRGTSAKGVSVSTRHAIHEVFLPKEKRELTIYKCLTCEKFFAEYKN